MKTRLLLVLLLVFNGLTHAQETERRFIYFNYNDYTLTVEGKTEIDAMFAIVGNGTITKVEVYGYTDSDGDEAANIILSQNRVVSVRSYIISKGVDEKIISSESFGEQHPSYPNETEAGKRKNRRAEVVFTYNPLKENIAIPPVAIEEKIMPAIEHTNESLGKATMTRRDMQVFHFRASGELVVKGKSGTIVTFPKNCFTDKNGKTYNDDIEVELIEVYRKSEMINHTLQTTSNGKLLESGGMIYVKVTGNGQDLQLGEYKSFKISFPTSDKNDDMTIFYADTINGQINWNESVRFTNDGTYLENRDALNAYVFDSAEMGWINCDRFIGQKNLTDVLVKTTDTAGVSFCLVFKDINSIMNVANRVNKIEFFNVPIGQVVTLVAFKKTEDKTYYYSKELTIKRNHSEPVTLEAMSEEEFQKRIKEFD